MRWLDTELSVLTTCVSYERLKQFALIERTDDRSYHIHQLELLSFHIAREQLSGIGSEFKNLE